jgi:hypothetical protein
MGKTVGRFVDVAALMLVDILCKVGAAKLAKS